MADIIVDQEQVKAMKIIAENMDLLHYKITELEDEKTILATLLVTEKSINKHRTEHLHVALHNLRSPLTNIQLSTSLIQRYYHRLDQQKIFAHLDKIIVAVNDFTALLDDFSQEEFVETTKIINPVLVICTSTIILNGLNIL